MSQIFIIRENIRRSRQYLNLIHSKERINKLDSLLWHLYIHALLPVPDTVNEYTEITNCLGVSK